MIKWRNKQWDELLKGYKGKRTVDANAKRNMDAFTGDVVQQHYLPRYSVREGLPDYNDRLRRAENNYFNFPRKIMRIYANAIFRQTEPTRSSDNKDISNFFDDVDGNKTKIGRFSKEKVFVLQQLTGGCLVVIDKPQKTSEQPISRQQQEQLRLFPYAYVLPWENLINFECDQFGRFSFVVLSYPKHPETGEKRFKVWDTTHWWIVNTDQKVLESGEHGLGSVPVIPSIALGDPRHNFQVPISPFNDIVQISLKIFEEMSRLDQMIVHHIFLRIAMPETMFKKIQEHGAGNVNALLYPDGYKGQQAHYIEVSGTEIKTMIDLIFDKYPHMILEMADIRSKTDKPREESGVAKIVDSSDEMTNLIEKAEQMEEVENRMVDKWALWEKVTKHDTTISYSKNFDVKSVHEQLEEMTKLFKEDLHAPTFAKEVVKRVTRKMLGNVSESTWTKIEAEIDESIDPALNLEDISHLVGMGALNIVKIAMRYNPELKDEATAKQFILANQTLLRGITPADTDGNPET